MMKRMLSLILCLLFFTGTAFAADGYEGHVVSGETVSITAPYGGTVSSVNLRAGSPIRVGDAIATMKTTRILASEDGTVRGLFAQPGDRADGTVLYLMPVSKFIIEASISTAHESAESKYVTIGEKVYIKCAPDGSHRAEGVITSVSGSDYVVQATAGELYMEEKVYIYRTPDCVSEQRLGSGKVNRTEAVAVKGSGSLLKIHVEDGEEVERGQLLFECVEGDLDALIAQGDTVLSTADGVIAQVNVSAGQKIAKGDVLLTVYQTQDYQIAFSVTEEELPYVKIGSPARIYFNWNDEQSVPFHGTVTDLSYVGETTEDGEVVYQGYIAFAADETVRLGMNVTVMLDE